MTVGKDPNATKQRSLRLNWGVNGMDEAPDGRYVRYDDYAVLESKLPRWRNVADEPVPADTEVLAAWGSRNRRISVMRSELVGPSDYWMPLPEPPK